MKIHETDSVRRNIKNLVQFPKNSILKFNTNFWKLVVYTHNRGCLTLKIISCIPGFNLLMIHENFEFIESIFERKLLSIMNKSITAIILDFQKSRNSDFLQNHVRVHHAVKFLILVSFQFRYFQIRFFFNFCVNRDL